MLWLLWNLIHFLCHYPVASLLFHLHVCTPRGSAVVPAFPLLRSSSLHPSTSKRRHLSECNSDSVFFPERPAALQSSVDFSTFWYALFILQIICLFAVIVTVSGSVNSFLCDIKSLNLRPCMYEETSLRPLVLHLLFLPLYQTDDT